MAVVEEDADAAVPKAVVEEDADAAVSKAVVEEDADAAVPKAVVGEDADAAVPMAAGEAMTSSLEGQGAGGTSGQGDSMVDAEMTF